MRSVGLVLAGLLGIALAGCGSVEGQVIDTWPVGPAYTCSDEGNRVGDCDGLVRAGLAGLADRDGKLGEVVGTQLHHDGALTDPVTGDQILSTRSGNCCSVLVVRLADGTTRAISVGYPGISQEPMAFPWATVPGSENP